MDSIGLIASLLEELRCAQRAQPDLHLEYARNWVVITSSTTKHSVLISFRGDEVGLKVSASAHDQDFTELLWSPVPGDHSPRLVQSQSGIFTLPAAIQRILNFLVSGKTHKTLD